MQTEPSSRDQSPFKTSLPLTSQLLSLCSESPVQQQELFKETSRFENVLCIDLVLSFLHLQS